MFRKFEVGRQAPQPFWPRFRQPDGAILEQLKDGETYSPCITVYYNAMTKDEADTLQTACMQGRYISEGPHFLGLVAFGGLRFEIPYDQTKRSESEHAERARAWEKSGLVQVTAIDSADGIIRALRLISFPRLWLDAFLRHIEIIKSTGYSAEYNAWAANLQRQYDTTDILWDHATDAGAFGE